MQRARRLASVAVIASLAVTGLAACRSEPDVAAYLPNDTVTMDEVSAIYDDAQAKLSQAGPAASPSAAPSPSAAASPAGPPKMPITRQDIVNALISQAVLTEVSKQHNQSLPAQLPTDQVARSVGLPPTAQYVKTFTEVQVMVVQLNQSAQGVDLTPADLKDVYEKLVAAGGVPPQLDLQKFITGLPDQGRTTLSKAFSVRRDVEAQAAKMHLRVNPRYEPAEISVLTDQDAQGKPLALVTVPVTNSDGTLPVTDAG
jgi:hypothetical protein